MLYGDSFPGAVGKFHISFTEKIIYFNLLKRLKSYKVSFTICHFDLINFQVWGIPKACKISKGKQ